jgi:hypothetical protein
MMRAAAVAGGQEFLSRWVQAAPVLTNEHGMESHSQAPPEPDTWASYTPAFFSPEEMRILDAFTSILIPTDETPGAREAHVVPFIDFVLNAAAEYAPEMQAEWRRSVGWLRDQRFGDLAATEQVRFMEKIAAPERSTPESDEGHRAYKLIKDMTVHAFYTSRAGLVDVLEYKGNSYLLQFPGCEHPEHHTV